MKDRIFNLVKYYIYWLIFFILQKPLFMIYHTELSLNCPFEDWIKVITSGISLDLASSAYLLAIPSLCWTISSVFPTNKLRHFFIGYHYIMLLIISIITVADLKLYTAWGFRIDTTPLFYVDSPKNAMASITIATLLFLVVLLCSILYFGHLLFRILSKWRFDQPKVSIINTIGLLLITAALFIPIRGGFSVATLNVGKVYFSENMFLNHAAINPAFNFMQSFFNAKIDTQHYTYMDDSIAKEITIENTKKGVYTGADTILKTQTPNIIYIVLESFSAASVEALGGATGVTPNLNKYSQEGIFFRNIYANSFRTDRGLVSILSSYPAQPTTSIMKFPSKSQSLPSISAELEKRNYQLKYYYGGDENFTNMRSYLVGCEFHERVSENDFAISERTSKWGVHDHILFDKVIEEIKEEVEEPFMKVIQTSSSHEPFEVPYARKFKDDYLNSIAYTDSCVGNFIEQLRETNYWNNTLIVLIPDHSFRFPATMPNHIPARYHIPVIWLGGAIKSPQIIDRIGSQIDISTSLLATLGYNVAPFTFAHNLFDPNSCEYAFYTFNDGFGMVTKEGHIVYDSQAKIILETSGDKEEQKRNLVKGQAIVQTLYNDFESR